MIFDGILIKIATTCLYFYLKHVAHKNFDFILLIGNNFSSSLIFCNRKTKKLFQIDKLYYNEISII